jgi:uncharacterized protein (TIGR02466 family)
MSGKFSFTFNLGGKGPAAQAPARAATPAVVPELKSHDLFPTRIWQAHLDALDPYLERWVQAVLAMRAAHPKPAGRTVRQGWNSEDMKVLEREEFAPLRDAIRAACTEALREMGQGERAFYLQSWINLHDRGGFNFLHLHEGSLLSGGFYLQVPPGSGEFVFRDPRPGVIHGYVKGGVPNGHADVHLRPSDGLLVLFPCWMEHYVEPHEGDEPRITVAFNANPVDQEMAGKR